MQVAIEAGADPAGLTLIYCEAFELAYDGDEAEWYEYDRAAEAVDPPRDAVLSGYDIVCFMDDADPPNCSPLSCNGLAAEVPVNEYCLFRMMDEARATLDSGLCKRAEPGPYRILSVAVVAKP